MIEDTQEKPSPSSLLSVSPHVFLPPPVFLSPFLPLQASLHVENPPPSSNIISLTLTSSGPSIYHQHPPDQGPCSLHSSNFDSWALSRKFSPPPSDEQLFSASLITTSKPSLALLPHLPLMLPGPVSWAYLGSHKFSEDLGFFPTVLFLPTDSNSYSSSGLENFPLSCVFPWGTRTNSQNFSSNFGPGSESISDSGLYLWSSPLFPVLYWASPSGLLFGNASPWCPSLNSPPFPQTLSYSMSPISIPITKPGVFPPLSLCVLGVALGLCHSSPDI